jgi:hypothetical protein
LQPIPSPFHGCNFKTNFPAPQLKRLAGETKVF